MRKSRHEGATENFTVRLTLEQWPETNVWLPQHVQEKKRGKETQMGISGCSSLQLCPTVYDSMACSPPGSSVHGILQAPPSSRAEGLLFLHGLESNPGSSLQTEEEAGLP